MAVTCEGGGEEGKVESSIPTRPTLTPSARLILHKLIEGGPRALPLSTTNSKTKSCGLHTEVVASTAPAVPPRPTPPPATLSSSPICHGRGVGVGGGGGKPGSLGRQLDAERSPCTAVGAVAQNPPHITTDTSLQLYPPRPPFPTYSNLDTNASETPCSLLSLQSAHPRRRQRVLVEVGAARRTRGLGWG